MPQMLALVALCTVCCNAAPTAVMTASLYDESYGSPKTKLSDENYGTIKTQPLAYVDNPVDTLKLSGVPVPIVSPTSPAAAAPPAPVVETNTGEVTNSATCASISGISGQTHWKGALDFAAYKLKQRMNIANSTRHFVCEDVHVQILNTASLFIRGYLAGGNKSLYVIQVVKKNPDVELQTDLPSNIPGEFETKTSDEKIKVSKRSMAGSGANGAPETVHFARVLSKPKGAAQEQYYDMRMLKELYGRHTSPAVPPELIQNAQAMATAGQAAWTAELYPDTMTLTTEEARRTKFGHIPVSSEFLAQMPTQRTPTAEELAAVPAEYDPREAAETSSCVSWVPENQGSCGSCFTFAAGLVYSSRLCKKSGGRVNIDIAEQDYLSCNKALPLYVEGGAIKSDGQGTAANGCNGGNAINVWILQSRRGKVVRRCNPYVGKPGNVHACGARKCESPMLYKGSTKVYQANIGDVASVKVDLVNNGPLYASMQAFADFMSYKAGVYKKGQHGNAGNSHGGHAISLIGYGNQNNEQYWLAANSWGPDWGEKGYFRIAPGQAGFGNELFGLEVASKDVCPGRPSCGHGDFNSDCTCHCAKNWKAAATGGPCNTCALSCANGGIKTSKCTCDCAAGYFGDACENYVLGYWTSAAGENAKITIKWSFATKSWQGPSRVRRFAAAPSGKNPAITGTDKKAKFPLGSIVIDQWLGSDIPGYPSGTFVYSFELSLGKNEFGADKGYINIDIPLFKYDEAQKCFAGGHQPPAGTAITNQLCASSYTPAPRAQAGAAAQSPPAAQDTHTPTVTPTQVPTLTPTEHPTTTPTDWPTDMPAFPVSHPPTLPLTHTPTEVPTMAPLPAVAAPAAPAAPNAPAAPAATAADAPFQAPKNVPVKSCVQIVGQALQTTGCPCAEIEFSIKCFGPPAEWINPGETHIVLTETLEASASRDFGDVCQSIADPKQQNCAQMQQAESMNLIKSGVECAPLNGANSDHEMDLGFFSTAEECAKACKMEGSCKYFAIEQGAGDRSCYWEYNTACDGGNYIPASYDLFQISG